MVPAYTYCRASTTAWTSWKATRKYSIRNGVAVQPNSLQDKLGPSTSKMCGSKSCFLKPSFGPRCRAMGSEGPDSHRQWTRNDRDRPCYRLEGEDVFIVFFLLKNSRCIMFLQEKSRIQRSSRKTKEVNKPNWNHKLFERWTNHSVCLERFLFYVFPHLISTPGAPLLHRCQGLARSQGGFQPESRTTRTRSGKKKM